jgi:flagellar hook-associated protein 2
MSKSLKDLDAQYDELQARVEAKVEYYRAQFTQLDLLVSRMNSTSSYLTQQFASMANSGK